MFNRRLLLIVGCCVLAIAASLSAASSSNDSTKIASLVNEMNSLDFSKIESLPAVKIESYNLPAPGVDVMRVRLEETYTIDGIGEDTVELSGWIAVRHGASRVAPGESTLTWTTAITDTEFVGMELQGDSEVFGPVRVSLDTARPAIGQVGKIDAPERAQQLLLAANEGSTTSTAPSDVVCRAPVNVKISMSQLGLEMKTKTPAVWFSKVSTIPPVGHVASVTAEPVALLSAERQVGSLVSGVVKFREVVRTVELSKDHQILAVAP